MSKTNSAPGPSMCADFSIDIILKVEEGEMANIVLLLPISEFVLDKKFQRNASKFDIFYIDENPKVAFPNKCPHPWSMST